VLGAEEPEDDAVARARELYAPLLAWLDEAGGDDRGDVVSAAVFTTQDPIALLPRLREVIWRDVPAPEPRALSYFGGFDGFKTWEGEYDGPNFQAGEPPYRDPEDGGEIVVDPGSGEPVLQRLEPIHFAISIPEGDMPASGWPVVLYAHGTGGSFESFLNDGTAERMAAEGLAVLSIDQVLHGPRNPQGESVELDFFNFGNPVAARDNVRQGALDNFQLVRLVSALAIDERHPGAEVARLDPDRIFFMGHSQGGLTGPPFLAYEPLVKGAVLSGAGGLIYLSLIEKTEPVDVSALVGQLIRDRPLDEFNPVLALVQMYLEPADPTNYARLLVAEPAPGVGPKDIFQSEGLIDHFTPPANIESLAVAMGLSPVEPELAPVPGFALRGIDWLEAPVSANLNGRTAVFLQYEAAANSDGHFVLFRVPAAERQHAAFLGSAARDGRAVLVE
jgi:pimeloyl-ACP methyl ester carboxylesterase